jgi:long-chain acyl-CoA synthetase
MATTALQVQDHPTLGCSTLAEAFQQTAALRPDAVALRSPGGATEITWAEYADRVERIAGGLASLGIGRGDTVAIMLLNRPEFHLVDSAALHLGATPFSVYNTSAREQVAYLFENAGNRVVFTQREFLPVVEDLVEHVILVDELEAFEDRTPSGFHFEEHWRAVEPSDILTLIYTSGTTGPPKGVQLTHANVMAEVRGCTAYLPVSPFGRVTSFLPSAHIADRWATHYSASIAFGCEITSVPDVRQIAQVLPEVRPTAWGSVPRIWEKLESALRKGGIEDPAGLPEEVKAGVRAKLGLDQADWLVAGAAPIAIETLQYFLDLGLPIQEVWGMSETSCCATINPRDAIKPGSCGKVVPGMTLRIAADGELLVRGRAVATGALSDDGWLHTGDLGELDASGRLTIVGRQSDTIVSGGENVAPAEVEAVLLEHPGVADIAALGRPDPEWGEAVVAQVVLRDGVAVTADELREHCAARLASFKVPKRFEVVEQVPRGVTGKLLRRELR